MVTDSAFGVAYLVRFPRTSLLSSPPTASRSCRAPLQFSPSPSFTGTATGSPTLTATATRSISATPPAAALVYPALQVDMIIVGGDEASLRAGPGDLLRRAISELSGVDGAFTTFTTLTTNYSTTEVGNVYGLINGTANATDLNATHVAAGSSVNVNHTDAGINSVYRRLRMLQAPTGCNPVQLPQAGSVTLPVTSAAMNLAIPPSYFAGQGATTPAEVAAQLARLRASLQRTLGNRTAVQSALASFVTAWGACTGMPASTGVITSISRPASTGAPEAVPLPQAVAVTPSRTASPRGTVAAAAAGQGGSTSDPVDVRVAVLAGSITAGVVILGAFAIWYSRRSAGRFSGLGVARAVAGKVDGASASNADHDFAHVCSATAPHGLYVTVRSASPWLSSAASKAAPAGAGPFGAVSLDAPPAAAPRLSSAPVWIRTCPHMSVGAAVAQALLEASPSSLGGSAITAAATATLQVGSASYPVATHGAKPLGSLRIAPGQAATVSLSAPTPTVA